MISQVVYVTQFREDIYDKLNTGMFSFKYNLNETIIKAISSIFRLDDTLAKGDVTKAFCVCHQHMKFCLYHSSHGLKGLMSSRQILKCCKIEHNLVKDTDDSASWIRSEIRLAVTPETESKNFQSLRNILTAKDVWSQGIDKKYQYHINNQDLLRVAEFVNNAGAKQKKVGLVVC